MSVCSQLTDCRRDINAGIKNQNGQIWQPAFGRMASPVYHLVETGKADQAFLDSPTETPPAGSFRKLSFSHNLKPSNNWQKN